MLKSRENLGFFLAFVGVVIFGGTLPFTKLAVAHLDPWFVSAGRAVVAAILAGVLLVVLKRRFPAGKLGLLIFTASMVCGLFPVFMGLGIRTVPASHGGVVLGVMPLLTAAISALVNKERPSLQFWLAAIAGALLVIGFSLRGGDGTLSRGDIFLFFAALCSSAGYVGSARLASALSGWEAISWCCIVALPVTIPVALYTAPVAPGLIPASAWIGFAYVAAFSMFIGFFAWNAGMVLAGVARVSQVQLLQTFVTLAIAIPLNGEHVDLVTWVFAVAVVAVVLLGRRARIEKKPAA
ncbi:MAG: DMT family transporter [Beijerinckiaceae bacterium]|nr:DMT family transporter [Beijerinckiaceae bacterium]